MAAPRKKKKPVSTEEKTFTFTFTTPEVIGLCAGAVAALCAFFVLGILLGRGYQPEKDVPEIAMMLPSQSINASGEVKGGVLKPEELDYVNQLNKKPESAVKPKEPEKKVAKAESKTAPAKKAEPVTETPATEVAAEKAEVQKDEPEFKLEIDHPEAVQEQKYSYVYQAASFGDEARAQSFADKLIASGVDSYVEAGQGGNRTWYRVFIRHTGTPDSTNEMKKVLARYGVKKPLLKSKKAI